MASLAQEKTISEEVYDDVVTDEDATGSQVESQSDRSSHIGDSDVEEDWDDWEEDSEACVCLFCEEKLPSAKETLSHCKDVHSFDFASLKTQLGMLGGGL